MSDFPEAHFGSADSKLADWRKTDDPDSDDEQIKTPPDVVAMLGFDPADEDDAQPRSDSALPSVFIPAGIRLVYHDTLPDRDTEAGYFEPVGEFGSGDGEGEIAVARRVRIGTEYRELMQPGRVLAHEAGHAIDHAMGAPSKSLAVPAPGERETSWEAVGAHYYLADADEFWAEACAVEHGPDDAMYFGGMSKARARELFGAEIGEVLTMVRQWRASLA